jgi:hypothetical protein
MQRPLRSDTWLQNRFCDAQRARATLTVVTLVLGGVGFMLVVLGIFQSR